eukprot:TRINITY_DN6225_c0_g1_i2.p1 TRINITY_DN6225_c0_g1~~TRINITY_DN6225_c0_g1_i2.p1  ORF type:complete len:216 (+),score=27.45 TRINITY_DN6225_c0_g1_i2:59-706(+)
MGDAGGLLIFVRSDVGGETVGIDLSPDACVNDVEQELAARGLRGTLMWQGEPVRPRDSLADLGVCPESVMQLTMWRVEWVRVSDCCEVKDLSTVSLLPDPTQRGMALGPARPHNSEDWVWELTVAGEQQSNFYVGVTRPDFDLGCGGTGLYGRSKLVLQSEIWVTVNGSVFSNETCNFTGLARRSIKGRKYIVRSAPSPRTQHQSAGTRQARTCS